jgi:hypothetical protein
VLLDAVELEGSDAATVAWPLEARRTVLPPRNAGPVGHDELASPGIAIVQPTALPLRASTPRRRPASRGPDAGAYFVLNLGLGALIVAALAVLLTRQVAPTPQLLAPGADHAQR